MVHSLYKISNRGEKCMINLKNDEMATVFIPTGTEFYGYRYLGFHIVPDNRGEKYAVFRVFAPNAKNVFLVGDFNGWQETHPMERKENGIFEIFLSASILHHGQNYKYKITTSDGRQLYKADPYAVFCESSPATASKIFLSAPYVWQDDGYIKNRKRLFAERGRYIPLNIYKLLPASWKGCGTYKALSDELIPYLKQMGYTHVMLSAVTNSAYVDGQYPGISSFFVPATGMGDPDCFRGFVDALHRAGLGVILEGAPSHFSKCEQGLWRFDGTPIFEGEQPDESEDAPFDLGSKSVRSFLLSNAMFWIDEYHVDGLSCDLSQHLASNREDDVLSFFAQLNDGIHSEYPDIITIAKARLAIDGITDSVQSGGLGFSFARDRRLENEILSACDLAGAKLSHSAEHGICALSDNESFVGRLRCDSEERFAMSRLLLFCMMLSDSKKLTFSGSEIGWLGKGENGVDWGCLFGDNSLHKKHQLFVRDIGALYLSSPVLWEEGNVTQKSICGYAASLSRIYSVCGAYKEMIAVINFGKQTISDAKIETGSAAGYKKIFSSALSVYGGCEEKDDTLFFAKSENGKNYIKTELSPLSAYVFENADDG
ncbi:MAG: hypothetical protein E7656_07120 [Ruminococcaceae bacterium]|nr:hypothetical protein [Oscillospiraceae bacterium]